ncbi:MAG TPA: FeoB-associated Cys-rich membrane protein [Clostridia bacterium]|nr:FeoB-associated Cys-rich membrane protein [Clostridia bacterium]HPK15286.1 FeoB-associated Cys-rich membrane protein [Clostridia bacterium]
MLSFILENYSTILLSLVLLAVVTLVVVHLVKKKRSGKSASCDCCSGCPGEAYCHKH